MLALVAALGFAAASPTYARAMLKQCGPGEAAALVAPDTAWAPVKSLAIEHAKLRSALGATLPTATPRIMIFGGGGHLATTQYSIVLTRDVQHVWRFDAVGQSTIWEQGATSQPMAPKSGSLAAKDGRRIDAILADRCFAAEPTQFNSFDPKALPPLGIIVRTVEVTMTDGERRFVVMGDASGLSGELLTIVGKYL